MEIEGRVVDIKEESGTGSKGPWNKKTVVLAYQSGDRESLIAIDFIGEKASSTFLRDVVYKIHFNVSSREFNGRYYTSCLGWKFEIDEVSYQNSKQTSPQQQAPAPHQYNTQQEAKSTQQSVSSTTIAEEDDIPF